MPDLSAGSVLGGRFEVVGVLGYGGMATVYLVRDRLREEEIALKVLHDHLARSPSMRARLRREVRTAARLASPHALVAWDLHEADGHLALSMPLHRGVTLAEHVHQHGPLDAAALLALGRDLADALGEAHGLGIVHRDVTPPNVLLDAKGRAALTDFGLVRSIYQNTQTATAVLGTSGYAAPEVYHGARTDPRSDLYSLGAVLHFAATGSPPFEAPDPVGVLRRQLDGDRVPLHEARPDLPEALCAGIDRLLALDPEARPADAAAAVAGLEGEAVPPPALPEHAFPAGPWAVELAGTERARPEVVARGVAEVLGVAEVVEPPALHAARFTLVAGVDRATADRLAAVAEAGGFTSDVVDGSRPGTVLPPLVQVVGHTLLGALAGGLVAAFVMAAVFGLAVLFGPVPTPSWAPDNAALNQLAYGMLGVLLSALPVLFGARSAWRRILAGSPAGIGARGPVVPDRPGSMALAGILGTVLLTLPAGASIVATWTLVNWAPPLVRIPSAVRIAPHTADAVVLWGTVGLAAVVLLGSAYASFAAAAGYRDRRMAPALPVAFPSDVARKPERGVLARVRRELSALSAVVEPLRGWLPEAAAQDVRGTVRRLSAEVDRLAPRLGAVEQELRLLDGPAAAVEVERLEARLARARTLARASGSAGDVAELERALAAQVDVLEQSDVVEGHLTRLNARLLEVGALAARCRVQIVTAGEQGEGEMRSLMDRLGATLDQAAAASAEVEAAPEATEKLHTPRARGARTQSA